MKVVPGLLAGLLGACLCAAPRPAVQRPRPLALFGGSPSRNMANTTARGVPDDFCIKKGKRKHVKWSIRLGGFGYGSPVVSGGRVFVGTNNEVRRDPKVKGDKGVMACFREKDGQFLWQIVHNKLPDDGNDFPSIGVVSTPCVEGNR